MIKRVTNFLILILFPLFSVASYSQDLNYYVSGMAGIALPQDSTTQNFPLTGDKFDAVFDPGFAFLGAIGVRRDQYRTEAEFGYQSNDADSVNVSGLSFPLAGTGVTGDVVVMTGLVSAFYDIDIGHEITPYLTAGVGFANVDVNIALAGVGSLNVDDTVFAYQIGAGVGYALNDNITLDARYRYLATADLEFETVTSEFKSHNVLFGMRIDF